MTPETRAARDRIAADADEAESVHSSLATTRVADLRTVLAALNRALPTHYDHLLYGEASQAAPVSAGKPPVPTTTGLDWPRIPLDETEADYLHLVRIAAFAADMWVLGPESRPATTRADITRGQIAESLALLLELGVIDIDRERLAQWNQAGVPMNRPRKAAS